MKQSRPMCTICKTHTNETVKVTKGQRYTDQDGKRRQSRGAKYHWSCRKMQNKGLLSTPIQRKRTVLL